MILACWPGLALLSFIGIQNLAKILDFVLGFGEIMASFFTQRRRCWLWLLLAILFEVLGTSVMKLSQSGDWFLSPKQGLGLMFILIASSYASLGLAVRLIPVGVAYALWEGLGLAFIALVSVFLVGESLGPARALALGLIILGAVLVNQGTGHGAGSGSDSGSGKDRASTGPKGTQAEANPVDPLEESNLTEALAVQLSEKAR